MTKVLKLLGGGSLAAVLGVVLLGASGAFSATTVSAESPPNPPARFVGTVMVDGQSACRRHAHRSPHREHHLRRHHRRSPRAPRCATRSMSRRWIRVQTRTAASMAPSVTFYIGGKKAAETGIVEELRPEHRQPDLHHADPDRFAFGDAGRPGDR